MILKKSKFTKIRKAFTPFCCSWSWWRHTQGVVSVCVKKKMSQSICRLMSRDEEISEPDLSLGGLTPFFTSFFQGRWKVWKSKGGKTQVVIQHFFKEMGLLLFLPQYGGTISPCPSQSQRLCCSCTKNGCVFWTCVTTHDRCNFDEVQFWTRGWGPLTKTKYILQYQFKFANHFFSP